MMRGIARAIAVASLALSIVLHVAPVGAATPDPERGMQLHKACLRCHGTSIYEPHRRKITSFSALRKEVERWNRSYEKKLSTAELEDIIAYLNRDFYQFLAK